MPGYREERTKERAEAGTSPLRRGTCSTMRSRVVRCRSSARALAASASCMIPHAPEAGNSASAAKGSSRPPAFARAALLRAGKRGCAFCLRESRLLRYSHTGSTLLKIMANDPASARAQLSAPYRRRLRPCRSRSVAVSSLRQAERPPFRTVSPHRRPR